MRNLHWYEVLASIVCVAFGLAGCAGGSGQPPVIRTVSSGAPNAVEETVRVPSAEVMPENPTIVADAATVADPLPSEEAIMEHYHIGPSDVLQFRNFDDPDLNTTAVVRHDGMISLPWVPDIQVGGLTREEATEAVREAYQELYYEAEVSLQIIEAASKTYTVMGDVNRPSEFPYIKPLTLIDAIIAAGGLRVNQRGGDSFVGGQGQLVKAYIVRGVGEARTTTPYDLRNLEKSGSHLTQTPVLPGDIVFIPEGINLIYVLGAVGRPGIQPVSEGMTLLQVIAAANGINESIARDTRIVVIHEVDESQTEVQLINYKIMVRTGFDVPVHPGDIIFVPRKRLITLTEFIGRATGLVTPIFGVTSRAMGLYTQAFDTYYAKDRADLLYNSDNSNQLQTNLQLLEAVRQVGVAADDLTNGN